MVTYVQYFTCYHIIDPYIYPYILHVGNVTFWWSKLSIFIHIYPYLSIFIHIYPYLPIFIHIYPYLSIFIHTYPYLSIFIHIYPYLSIYFLFFFVVPYKLIQVPRRIRTGLGTPRWRPSPEVRGRLRRGHAAGISHLRKVAGPAAKRGAYHGGVEIDRLSYGAYGLITRPGKHDKKQWLKMIQSK